VLNKKTRAARPIRRGKGLNLEPADRAILEGRRGPQDAIGADGLSLHRNRPRHDEVRMPRGHQRAKDDWPVQQPKSDPDVTPSSTKDRTLFRDTIEMMGIALATGLTVEMRSAVREAYRTIAGYEHGEMFTSFLGILMRQREQARVAQSIRDHRRGLGAISPTVEGRIKVATTGAEIVEQLQQMAAMRQQKYGDPQPFWLTSEKLAKLIDLVAEQVNLGGAGGPKKSTTPEKHAQKIVELLKKQRAANSRPL